MIRGWKLPPLLLAGCLAFGATPGGAGDGTAKRRALDERPTAASASLQPIAPERLQLPAEVEIEPIRAGDLLPAGGATISFDGVRGTARGLRTRVLRRLDGLWRFDYPTDRAPAAALQVDYELHGLDGRRDALSLAGGVGGGAEIPVRLQPVGPRLLRSWNGRSWLEGGVILDLDLEQVRHAGTYRGTLFVTVNRL